MIGPLFCLLLLTTLFGGAGFFFSSVSPGHSWKQHSTKLHTHIGARIGRGDTAVTRARVPREQRIEAQEDEEIENRAVVVGAAGNVQTNRSQELDASASALAAISTTTPKNAPSIFRKKVSDSLANPPPPLSRFPFSLVRILTYLSPSLPLSLPARTRSQRAIPSIAATSYRARVFVSGRAVPRTVVGRVHALALGRAALRRRCGSGSRWISFRRGVPRVRIPHDRHHPRPV